MWRRSILKLSSRQSFGKTWRQISPQVQCWQISPCISTRRELSSAPEQNLKPQPTNVPPTSGNSFPKYVFGSVVIGASVFAAYQTGYLDQLTGGIEQNSSVESTKTVVQKSDLDNVQPLVVLKLDSSSREEIQKSNSLREETESLNPIVESTEQTVETDTHLPHLEALDEEEDGSQFRDSPSMVPQENTEEKDFPVSRQCISEVEDKNLESKTSTDVNFDMQSTKSSTRDGSVEEVKTTPMSSSTDGAPEQIDVRVSSQEDESTEDRLKELTDKGESVEKSSSLLEAYHLKDKAAMSSLDGGDKDETNKFYKDTEALIAEIEEYNDAYISKDGKLIVDFLQAIHAAEKRQAELDSRVFADEKRALKEKLEKELRDAQVRELMHAEEAAILDKELKRERTKSAAAQKSLQEKLEEKYQKELERKENEVELRLRCCQDMAKAQLAAEIASEKAAQIEKIAEANLHVSNLGLVIDLSSSKRLAQPGTGYKITLIKFTGKKKKKTGLISQSRGNFLQKMQYTH